MQEALSPVHTLGDMVVISMISAWAAEFAKFHGSKYRPGAV